ncbi:retrovirus-related pol polyprotein LINE-1 [Tanacetum coccineum]
MGSIFFFLFNETPFDESSPEGSGEVGSSSPHMHYDCYYLRINQEEVRDALQNIGRNKAVGPDQILLKLGDKGTSKRYTRVIKDMYKGVKSGIRTTVGNTEFFPVEVGLHQRSTISPYLFTLILDEISRGIQNIPWCMIFADDIVLIAKSAEWLNNRLESWRKTLEENGLRVSRENMKYLRCDYGRYEVTHHEMDIRIGDQILQPNKSFRYLVSVIHRRWRCSPYYNRLDGMEGGYRSLRRRGRPKLRWEDKLKLDMNELLLSEEMTSYSITLRDRIRSLCLLVSFAFKRLGSPFALPLGFAFKIVGASF